MTEKKIAISQHRTLSKTLTISIGETSGGNCNDQAEYRTWLAKRFGVPYLADLVEQKAGVKADLAMKILG